MAGCPSCGAVPASPDSRFCDRCGSPLGAASGAASQGAQARKVVTVLFADLVGSTATQEGMDPESVRRWLDRYYAVVRQEIDARGGRVVKFIGDGVMAVFGVPEVREDDADRAVAAARAMQGAVAELGGPDGQPGVGLRVGVNTGEVVVTAADDDVVGDVVNVAARLEQAARPGEVLVGEATFRLVRTRAQLRALPPLELKGKAEPVPAFLLVSLERTAEDASSSPFVGRAGELERLTAVLDAVVGERRPQMASIVGTPGVGKSRLVRELGVAAAKRARVVVVRCDPAGGATFAPVAAALRTAASLDDDAGDDTVLAGLTALFDEDEPDRHRIAERAAAVLGVGEPGLPEETFWAVRRLVENAARRGPMLFVFEDVHWAEPLLLDLIENLATFTKDVPLLLVLTARPELREQRPGLVEVGGRVTAAIHLEGLAVDESRRLTRALLDGAPLPTALLDRVAAASEGNPLFVRELVRMLVDDGVLRHDAGSWTAVVDARAVEVPLSIHAVLAARIDRLPREEQEVLGAASILGRTFARGALLPLLGPEVGAHLDEHLEGLRSKELVERAGTQWLDEPQLRFHHALVQDAAYRRLLKEVRADLHEKAAAWLEGKIGDLAEHDDLIGYQLEQAHVLRRETGSEAEELGRAAAERLRTAGRRSLEADDRPGAAALLGRALACLPVEDPTRPEVLIECCEALLAMGEVTEAAPVVGELASAAAGDPRLEGWAACFAGELANLRDPRHLADTVGRAADAAVTLDGLGDHAGAAKAHAVRAASLARLGRIGECERALDQALGSARAAGDRRRATAILAGAPAAALWGPTPVTRASGRCLDVVRVLRITSRAPAVEAISLRCQAVLEALRGRDEAARRMLATARGSLEELGHALGLIEVDLAAGMVETLAGDLDSASRYLEQAMEGFHELGIDVDAGLAAALLARVRIAQGAPAEALALTVESERLGGDDLKTSIAWRSVRAAALADEGDLDEARRLAEEAVALAEPTDALIDRADALVALAEVLAHAGAEEGAAAAARRALELYERKEATVPAANARWLLGVDDGREVPSGAPNPAHALEGVPVGPMRSTKASELSASVAGAMTPFDRAALAALVAPDLVNRDRRPIVGSEEPFDLLESAQAVHDVGVREVRRRVLGLRGDHLVLLNADFRMPPNDDHPDGGGLDILQLMEADDTGRLRTNMIWEPDQAAEAWAELDRRYLDQLEPGPAGVWQVAASLLTAMLTRDWEAMAATMSSGLVAVDHRPAGWGSVDRDRFVELYRSSATLAPDAWFGFTDVLAITDRGVVGEAAGWGTTVDGGDFRTAATAVLEVADGVIVRIDYFPPDRIDLALALLDEPHGPHENAEADAGMRSGGAVAHPLENPATRLFDRALAALLAGEPIAELLSPEMVMVDHRPLIGGSTAVGPDEGSLWTTSFVQAGFDRVDNTVLAVRGDHLAVVRSLRHAGSSEVEVVSLLECDESGRGRRLDTYDLSQLDDVRATLEARYSEWLGPERAAVLALQLEGLAGLSLGDLDAPRRRTSDDFVLRDHRPLSFGTMTREMWLRSVADLIAAAPGTEWSVEDVVDVCARGALFRLDVRGTRDGGAFSSPMLVVAETRGGQIAHTDLYALEDRATAEIRFRELASESPVARAWRRFRESNVTRDRAGALDCLAAGAQMRDHRPIVGMTVGGDDLGPALDAFFELDVEEIDWHPIARRGGDLELGRLVLAGRGIANESLMIPGVDASGRIDSYDVYELDQLDEAYRALDERFLAGEARGSEAWRIHVESFEAMNARDLRALEAQVREDFTAVDHRPLGWGTLSRAEYLGLYPTMFEQSPDVRWRIVADRLVAGSVVSTEVEVTGRSGGSGGFGIRFVSVLRAAGERGALLEIFPPEEEVAALARARELLAELDP